MTAFYMHVYDHHGVWRKSETESCADALRDDLLKTPFSSCPKLGTPPHFSIRLGAELWPGKAAELSKSNCHKRDCIQTWSWSSSWSWRNGNLQVNCWGLRTPGGFIVQRWYESISFIISLVQMMVYVKCYRVSYVDITCHVPWVHFKCWTTKEDSYAGGWSVHIFSAISENGRKPPGKRLTCRNVHTNRGLHVLACLFGHRN